jgi:capsular polysaccharide biosynthesis protein
VVLSHVEPSISGGDRIYITRQNATNRRIINEREVRDLLSQFGFQCVALESLSVMEQAALLAKAEVIVAPHGGGLTNTVFCQPGTKVIEIFSPQYVYVCYWLISNLVELDYYYLTGIVPEGYYLHHFLYPDARTEDIWVDLRDLSNVLNLAGVV